MTVAVLESKWTKASRVCLYLAVVSVVLGCIFWIVESPTALHLDRGVWWPGLGAAIGAMLGVFIAAVSVLVGTICGLIGIARHRGPAKPAWIIVGFDAALSVLGWWLLLSVILYL